MKKFICAAAVFLLLFSSCGREKAAPVRPDNRFAKESTASFTVSDGEREVTLAVERAGETLTAAACAPAALAGVKLMRDGMGWRLCFPGGELALSAEAAAWAEVMTGMLTKDLTAEDVTTSDGVCAYTDGGFDVKVTLDENGVPASAVIGRDGVERKVRMSLKP